MIHITICIQEFFEEFFIIARLGPRSRCVLYMGAGQSAASLQWIWLTVCKGV